MSKANEAIGTCPCPVCRAPSPVKKFMQRAATEQGKRKAGKLYLDCPIHGRWGFDGKPAITEHILENMTWPSADAKREFAGALPQQSPALKPAESPPAPKPALKPALASTRPAALPPAQASTQSAKKPGFWPEGW